MYNFFAFLIKYTVLSSCDFYAFAKFSNSRIKWCDLLFIPLFLALSVALYFLSLYAKVLLPTCILAITFALCLLRFKRSLYNTLTLSTMSLALALVFVGISVCLGYPVAFIVYPIKNDALREIIFQTILSVAVILGVWGIFKIKRFKSGIVPIENSAFGQLLINLCTVIILICSFSYTPYASDHLVEFIIITLVFFGLSLLLWWRKSLKENYIKLSQAHSQAAQNDALTAAETEKAELAKQNEELAKIIHRDNKLIPAMQIAVKKICEKYPQDKDAAEVLKNLDSLYFERVAAVEAGTENSLPKTGIASLDAIASYVHGVASANGVEFDFDPDPEAVTAFVNSLKNKLDLNVLLSDLGVNAIAAAKANSHGKVKAVIDFAGGIARLCIFDNGGQFDEKVLRVLGEKQITTHQSDGGSGIGLVHIFEILKNNFASLCIDEETDEEGFAKCVCVCADRKFKHYIRSKRDVVKKICFERCDLILTDELPLEFAEVKPDEVA